MLYHYVLGLLVFLVISMQSVTLTHAMEHAEEPHHDCVICEAGIVSSEIADTTPTPINCAPYRTAEPVFYDASYKSAVIMLHPGRGPPPRAPPLTQV